MMVVELDSQANTTMIDEIQYRNAFSFVALRCNNKTVTKPSIRILFQLEVLYSKFKAK